MKNLILHPLDLTTDFLLPIYAPLKNKTVIRGGVPKSEVRKLIQDHDRVILLGHGSPYGLLSRGQFEETGQYIIDESMGTSLMNKSNSIFIWCYADQFVQIHGLSGLCTGMFISELGEADYCGFDDIDQHRIDESNGRFVSIVSKYINEPLKTLYNKLLIEYEIQAKTNSIARFNLERLYLICLRTRKNSSNIAIIDK